MICKNCNTQNPDGATFCATCGTPVVQDNAVLNAHFCTRCGTSIPDNCSFCPVCGTKAGTVASAGGSDVFAKMTPILKNIFVAPMEAVKASLEERNPLLGLGSLGIAWIASLIMLLMVSKDASIEFGYIFGFSLFLTVMCALPPFVGTIVACAVTKKKTPAIGILNAFAGSNIYMAIMFFVSGIAFLIDEKVFVAVFLFAILLKAYQTISVTNQIAGNILEKPAALFATIGTSWGIKLVSLIIMSEIVKDAIESMISSLFGGFSLF